jgi:hypothetical protein
MHACIENRERKIHQKAINTHYMPGSDPAKAAGIGTSKQNNKESAKIIIKVDIEFRNYLYICGYDSGLS